MKMGVHNMVEEEGYFVHETSTIEDDVKIGEGTKIWHYAHIREKARIGQGCTLCTNVYVDKGVEIGDNVNIQNGVSVYQGVTVGDDVLLGPHMTFTNDVYPRAEGEWNIEETEVKKGVSIGAHATILSGLVLNEYCMVGAGAVVTKDIPANTIVYGNPAVVKGFVCDCGKKFESAEKVFEDMDKVIFRCSECDEEVKVDRRVYKRIGKSTQSEKGEKKRIR